MAKKKSKYNPSLLRPTTKVNYPHSAEREYYRVLRALVRAMVKATKESLVLLKSQWNVRHDETESERVINAVKDMLEKAGYKKAALDELLRIRANADSTVKANIARAFRDVLAVDVFISETDTFVKVTDEWFNQQSKLVDSIVGQYTDKLGTIISNGVQRGTMYSEVAEEIKKLYKTTDSRAKFIARNEISNLNAITTKVRQEDAGIKVYEWSSSEDERVRPEHAFYDGKLFYWNNHKMGELNGVKVYPTPKYHPGMDYNCRCVALPIIDAEAYDPKTIVPMAKPEPKKSKVLQKSDMMTSKNITVESLRAKASVEGVVIDDKILSLIVDTVDEFESKLNKKLFNMVDVTDIPPTPSGKKVVLQTDVVQQARTMYILRLNSNVFNGATLDELDALFAKSKRVVAKNLKEAVIHEIGHVRCMLGKRRPQIQEMWNELYEVKVSGISSLADEDGAEAIAESEILVYNGVAISEELKRLREIYIGEA